MKAAVPAARPKRAPHIDRAARLSDYDEVVKKSRLVTIALRSVAFEVNRNVAEDDTKPTVKLHGQVVEFSRNPEISACFSAVEWTVSINVADGELARCAAVYDTIYDHLPEGIEDDIVSTFAQNFARPATYAYFRALYATLDSGAQLHSPTLPILKFMPNMSKVVDEPEAEAPQPKKRARKRVT